MGIEGEGEHIIRDLPRERGLRHRDLRERERELRETRFTREAQPV
jgi:hypothetical protein